MLVDEVRIMTKGGDGGRGALIFGEDQFSKRPAGADGGNGGSVYIIASRDVADLSRFRYEKSFEAEKGGDAFRSMQGKDGADIFLKVPRGTIVYNITSGESTELLEEGMKVRAARGGTRGRGNAAFSTARKSEPGKRELGHPGYEAEVRLELQLIADIGLVGLPNVGKSSLLNTITGAKSKVGNYNFTTLEPFLGALPGGNVMADIPGIIEGASEGKGLGVKFLRHIKRTKVIAHCISAESENPAEDYKVIRGELEKYSDELAKKPEFLIITKIDALNSAELKKKEALIKKLNKNYALVSIIDDKTVKNLVDALNKFVKKSIKSVHSV
ncbi:MAG TPA: GTPase ObgE [Candidatus Paceibacterota bacterium]|nr:GTPase ObgE [Candidatus Paceibacterota bacterium]